MPLRRTAAPDTLPLTVDDLRFDLRLIDTAQDDDIEGYIAAATDALDGAAGALGRALVEQRWELLLDRFPCASEVKIPLPPLRSVESITYVDTAGATQTLATSVYAVDTASEPGVVSLKYGQTWPATQCQRNAVTIAFTCGYGLSDDVPAALKSALKLMVKDRYFQTQDSAEAVANLISLYRVFA